MKNKGETAVAMMAGGWNCAQSVLGVFCEDCGLDRETAMKLASGFGAGMARKQEVCGAVSGAIMVIGLKHGQAPRRRQGGQGRDLPAEPGVHGTFRRPSTVPACAGNLLSGCDLRTEAGR